jgi:hypothetical protein
MTEFKELVEHIGQIEGLLDHASATPSAADPFSPLGPLDAAWSEMQATEQRVEVFQKRAAEKDPDRKVYGPKMVERVLEMVARFSSAREHAEELEQQLESLRRRRQGADEDERNERQAAAEAKAAATRAAVMAAAAERGRVEGEKAAARAAADRAEQQRVAERLRLIAEGAAGADPRRGAAPAPEVGLSLLEAEAKLRSSCGAAEHREALQSLHLIASNAIAHPEEPHFRSLRLLNEHLQHSVARHGGGVEVLMALGFVERETVEGDTSVLHYVMEEPTIDDIDAWARWFEGVKERRDALGTIMKAEGIRVLPTATKGAAHETVADPPPASRMAGLQVIHGQAGGGH